MLSVLAVASMALAACSSSDEDSASTTLATEDGSTATTGSDSSSTTPTTLGPGAYDFTELDAIVEGFVAENELNGAGLIVVHETDGVIFEDYWGEFDADRISFVASSSKQITAGVLLRLQDDGLIDLNAPVSEVVDWGSAHPDIIPAQLISNSSGLVGLVDEGSEAYLCQFVSSGTIQDCAETIFTTEGDDDFVVPPDTEFRYGGGQWQVAGALAEIVSGKSWDELIEEIYVEPCGVVSLGYNNHFLKFPGAVGAFTYPEGFSGDAADLEPTLNPSMEGGAYLTVPDYGKLLLMHLHDGRCGENQVLTKEALNQMRSDRIGEVYDGEAGAADTGYGMGWWVDRKSGLLRDPGAYGAFPWLDLEDGYGAYLVVEHTSLKGAALHSQLRDPIDEAIAAARG